MSTKSQHIAKIILFGVLTLTLFLPSFSFLFNVKTQNTKGYYQRNEDVSFSISGFFNASYQKQKVKYVNQNFGLRNHYLFLNNEFNYTLFGQLGLKHIIKGKNNTLLDFEDIMSYFGKYTYDEKLLQYKISCLSFIQKELKKYNKHLIICIAPCKTYYHNDQIPDYLHLPKRKNNYEKVVPYFDKYKINYIDYASWFSQNRNNLLTPLFYKTSHHWSDYSSYLALDSLIAYKSKLSNTTNANMIVSSLRLGANPDNDLEQILNMYSAYIDDQALLFDYVWDTVKTTKTSTMVIGDSFYSNMHKFESNNPNEDIKFIYYNVENHSNIKEDLTIEYKMNALKSANYIVLIANQKNLPKIGWGFLEFLYFALKKSKPTIYNTDYNQFIIYTKNAIKKDLNWMKIIEEKAKVKQIEVDSMLHLDAIWAFENIKFN